MKPIRVLVPAILLIALSAYLSLSVIREWPAAATTGQRIATFTQAAYCVLGVMAGIAAVSRPQMLRLLLQLWVAAVTLTAVLAPVVWGEQSWLVGLVSGLAGGVIAALIAWWLFRARFPKNVTEPSL